LSKKSKERRILAHEPEPGYRTVFYVVLVAAAVYLSLIFILFRD
jgi:hypothetical protein